MKWSWAGLGLAGAPDPALTTSWSSSAMWNKDH